MKTYTSAQMRFLALRTIGNFFVLSSIFGMFLTFGPAVKNEVVYRYNRFLGTQYVVAEDSAVPAGFGDYLGAISPTPYEHGSFSDISAQEGNVRVLSPVDTDFGIVIPKINANAKVIPNVDAGNHDVYMEALRQGVAHASGTYFPGMGGNVYLFAHSTDNFWNIGRYNAIFYLLKELENGDDVDLFFEGKRYIYIVSEKLITDPTATAFLNEPAPSEQLTLQTCWPPGTTFKRLIVIAKPKNEVIPASAEN